MTSTASASVSAMWLVKVKAYGQTPIRLPNRMKKNSANTSGKNFLPSSPICSVHMPWMKS